jgi:hypothetical protein
MGVISKRNVTLELYISHFPIVFSFVTNLRLVYRQPVPNWIRSILTSTVEPWSTNLIRSWMTFVTRNDRKPKLCVLSEIYTTTDAVPPILPACRQPLLPACVFVTQDTVRHPRGFFFGKFVRDERRSSTDLFVMRGVREQICSWWEAFVMRGVREPICSWWEAFVNRFVRDERRSWIDFFVMRGVRQPICSWWEAFVNRFVRDERLSWIDLFVMWGVRESICSWWEAFVNRFAFVIRFSRD